MITYELHVLMGRDNPEKKEVVKCHDTGVNLRVFPETTTKISNLRTTTKPYTIPDGSTAVLKVSKPDETYVLKSGKVEQKSIFFELPEQTFTAQGLASAEVSIYGKDGRRVTTGTFYLDVTKECVEGCTESSGSYVDIIAEQIQAANNAADRAEEAAKYASATFTPFVSDDGVLSWSNDKGLANPEPVNLKGPLPENGVDYNTPEEQEEMVQKVLDLLPTWQGGSF